MAKKEITYTEAMAEIENILEKLENGNPDIDTLGAYVKRVSYLLQYCREKLKKTEEEVGNALKDINP